MHPIQKACLLLMLLGLPLAQLHAGSPVWKIEKGGSRLYLAGSVHFLSASDYPLPPAFETAYRDSQVVVFETDIEGVRSPEGSQRIMRRLSYSAGQTLRQHVNDSTYRALKVFFGSHGVSMAQIDQFRPGMVAMMIAITELQRLGLAGDGVDVYLSNRALDDGRQQSQLENVDEQIDFLANMGLGREDELLSYSLQEAHNIGKLMSQTKRAWRDGDMAELNRLIVEPMAADFPRIHENLLTRRNHAWMPRLEEMLADRKVEFVVVGAAHLVGGDGLLKLLLDRGYRVDQLR